MSSAPVMAPAGAGQSALDSQLWIDPALTDPVACVPLSRGSIRACEVERTCMT